MDKLRCQCEGFRWLDVKEPSAEHLKELAKEYSIPLSVIQDCLDPRHLPKYERIGDRRFYIVRCYDPSAARSADTIREFTKKIAIFVGADFLITIHRMDHPFFEPIAAAIESKTLVMKPMAILMAIIKEAILSFDLPLQRAELSLEQFEADVFSTSEIGMQSLRQNYLLKRKLSVMRRLFTHHSVMINPVNFSEYGELNAVVQDIKEAVEQSMFILEGLHDGAMNLMNLQLSLASHRTSEVVRVLTVFSVFFMPLTFIVGIYGMNFEVMPELKWEYGYEGVWVLMILVTIAIAGWFWKKGWLTSRLLKRLQRKW